MISKAKRISHKLFLFFVANIFIFITGLFIVAKLFYFNRSVNLVNEEIVMLVVSFVLVFSFLAPITFYPEKRIKYATIWNIVFSCVILMDFIYIRYFSSLPSIQSIFYANSTLDVMESVKGLLRFQDILLFVDIFTLYYFFNYLRKKKIRFFEIKSEEALNYLFVIFCTFSFFFILFYDFKNVKLLTTRTFDNRVTAERYGITGYHLLDIYRFAMTSFDQITKEEKTTTLTAVKGYSTEEENSKTGLVKGKNVILVQFESLQSSVLGKKIDGQEITPNLNQFLSTSDYFANHYYQIGYGGTADTDFVVNSSLYPLRHASTFVQYGNDDYAGLADVLSAKGYTTTAYHGFNRSFWNRNVALKSLGYQKFYGGETYKDYEKLMMGANDKDFLIKTADLITEQKTPSLNYVITLTSHFPFTLPDELKNLKLPNNYPKNISDYYQSIHYSDKAFGQFLNELKSKGLYDNSVIIVYGDHSASLGNISNPENDLALGLKALPSQKESIEIKKVPLLIHLPGQQNSTTSEEVSSHLDIMPTVLNLLGQKTTVPMFGRDLYGAKEPFYAAVLYFGGGFIESRDHAFVDGNIEGVENGTCYRVTKNDWIKTQNSECKSLVERREKEINLSEKLIKYNLVKDLK